MQFDLTDEALTMWIGQFQASDQAAALRLLDQIRFVDAEKFRMDMVALLQKIPDGSGEPIALYAERQIKTWKGAANRLFKESKGAVRRAFGGGPQPVHSLHAGRHETGSEGVVANIVTQVQRAHPKCFLDHPGPDAIRRQKVRRFVLVADFIGTGARARQYLDAAWRVGSTKSWVSGKFLRFEIICYASTPKGKAALENHPCAPRIHEVMACPTIDSFAPYAFDPIVRLCHNYGPKDAETRIPPLGFGGVGALIAFAHGMPNNAPRLLFSKGRDWVPLFPARTSSSVKRASRQNASELLARRLQSLKEQQLADLARRSGLDPRTDLSVLVLAALKRRPRTLEVVSARTGLDIAACRTCLESARRAGWIDEKNQLTKQAHRELDYLAKSGSQRVLLYHPNEGYYCPRSLRAPVERFS